MDRLFPTEPIFYVRSEFNLRKKRNSSYSVRAFARDLELSPSHLSEFLSGKSNLSHEKADFLAEKLKLKDEHKKHWCDLLMIHSRDKKDRDAAAFRIQRRLESIQGAISEKVYRAISDWYYFAILAYFGGRPDFSIYELSQRMHLSEELVENAIDTLIELQLLNPIDEGYEPTDDFSLVGNTISSSAIRDSHKQILGKSIDALKKFDMDSRQSQSLFITVPQKQIKAFHEELKNAVLEVAAKFSQKNMPNKNFSVQTITLQTFPLEEKGNYES